MKIIVYSIIFIWIYFYVIIPIYEAYRYANNNYKLCTPRPFLWIDETTNKWETRELTYTEKWWICFTSYLFR